MKNRTFIGCTLKLLHCLKLIHRELLWHEYCFLLWGFLCPISIAGIQITSSTEPIMWLSISWAQTCRSKAKQIIKRCLGARLMNLDWIISKNHPQLQLHAIRHLSKSLLTLLPKTTLAGPFSKPKVKFILPTSTQNPFASYLGSDSWSITISTCFFREFKIIQRGRDMLPTALRRINVPAQDSMTPLLPLQYPNSRFYLRSQHIDSAERFAITYFWLWTWSFSIQRKIPTRFSIYAKVLSVTAISQVDYDALAEKVSITSSPLIWLPPQ